MKLQMMTHGQASPSHGRTSPYYVISRPEPYSRNVTLEKMPSMEQAFAAEPNHPVDLRQCRSNPSAQPEQQFYQSSVASADCTSPGQQTVSSVTSDDFLLVEEHLRPLIKQELRYTIQSKRMARGLPGTVEIEPKLTVHEEPSVETKIKRARRRERNKVAAAKCRFKKKMISEKLQEESEHLEHVNLTLKREIQKLQEERQKLMYILNLHRPTCIVRSPAVSATKTSPFLNNAESSNVEMSDETSHNSVKHSDKDRSSVSPRWDASSEQSYMDSLLNTSCSSSVITQVITTLS